MTKLLARLNNIKKSYQYPLLTIKKFDILTGQCTIITGDNGSGKSTFLKIINGLVDADHGNIDFQQQNFLAKKRHSLAKESVYLSNNPYLFDLTVRNNIAYPLLLRGIRHYQNQLDKVLEWANLTHLQNRYPNNLSSGERQRVSIARTYIINPSIWLLDEPTEHLDSESKTQLYQLLNKLLEEKRSLIIATHLPEIGQHIPHQHLQLMEQQFKKTDT